MDLESDHKKKIKPIHVFRCIIQGAPRKTGAHIENEDSIAQRQKQKKNLRRFFLFLNF